MRGKFARLVRGWTVVLLLALAGCVSDTVLQDQSQRDATAMVALLNNSGIAAIAAKEKGGKGRYSVQVERGYYAQAIALLSAKGFPRDSEATFSELVAERGLLPSSREIEALRIDHALSLEIEELLMSQPEIVAAKVVVRSHFSKDSPSCAAILQTSRDSMDLEPRIRQLLVPLIPGIDPSRIQLTIEQRPSEERISGSDGVMYEQGRIIPVPLTNFLFGWRVAASDITNLALTLVGTLLLALGVGVVGGYWYGFYLQSRREGWQGAPRPATKSDRKRDDATPLL